MLSDHEKRTLARVLDTLIPTLAAIDDENPLLFRLQASDFDLASEFDTVIEQVTDEQQQREIRLFLHLLESGTVNRLFGQPKPFSQLNLEERTALLLAWRDSRLLLARKAFQFVKQLGLALFYVLTPQGERHPTWDVFGYDDPPTASQATSSPIQPLQLSAPTTLYTDALVIGSGAGGGVVAGELSAAGLDVIVVEKGGYYAETDFHGREMDSTRHLYERQGVLATTDLGVTLLAGSALGGGTLINWTASLRPPEHVLHEWCDRYGFSAATGADFQHSLDCVLERSGVTTAESPPTPLNALLEKGCHALGYTVDVIPRNVRACQDCGFCNYGCAFGAKQSTLKTYLQDAYERGARILVQAHVNRVLHRNGQAYGAELTLTGASGEQFTVTVQAKVVVVAAGSLHTPVLLLRSGLGNAHIGANLHLHPTTAIFSLFEQPVTGWRGAPMTRVSQQFSNLDGQGYGVWMETAPVHPGLAAQAFPWHSGRQHKRNMQQLDHFGNIIILARDRDGGRIRLGRDGQPKIDYRLSLHDARHLRTGLMEAVKVHQVAGAQRIYSPCYPLPAYEQGAALEPYLQQIQAASFAPHRFALFSAHQMSSCRIGGTSAIGALTPEGETYEIQNLFVADGSALPTAAGVNPMITIMGTAHYIAQHIKNRF
ncbi:MAG: GMC family oxidoreductase [Anaerolineae bacterium]|nr:GMC family oxidoreductase [Anaerolineae bacterium]